MTSQAIHHHRHHRPPPAARRRQPLRTPALLLRSLLRRRDSTSTTRPERTTPGAAIGLRASAQQARSARSRPLAQRLPALVSIKPLRPLGFRLGTKPVQREDRDRVPSRALTSTTPPGRFQFHRLADPQVSKDDDEEQGHRRRHEWPGSGPAPAPSSRAAPRVSKGMQARRVLELPQPGGPFLQLQQATRADDQHAAASRPSASSRSWPSRKRAAVLHFHDSVGLVNDCMAPARRRPLSPCKNSARNTDFATWAYRHVATDISTRTTKSGGDAGAAPST